MKIIGNRLGVVAPAPVRRKRLGGPLPPWHDDVPPDTIDIELLPRINRYERGPLRFRQLGNTQRKLAERLAIFRDALDEIEPGLAHSEEEMMEGLKEVMEGRRHMMTERQLRMFDLRNAVAESLAEDTKEAKGLEDTREIVNMIDADDEPADEEVSHLSSVLDDEIASEVRNHDSSIAADTKRSTSEAVAESSTHNEEQDDALIEGVPTQWLIDRLSAAGAR